MIFQHLSDKLTDFLSKYSSCRIPAGLPQVLASDIGTIQPLMVPHIIQRGHCILELGAHEAAILDLIDEVESASKDPRELSGLHQHFNRGVVFPLDLVGLRLKLLFILDAVV